MKYFLYLCEDIEDSGRAAQLRREHLQAHLAYVEAQLTRYAVAGPNRQADGSYRSSLFILQAPSRSVADEVMANDPYVRAGLYQPFTGVEFIPAAGAWIGGLSWKR